MRPNLQIGDCFSIESNGKYYALICGSVNRKTSPHYFNFVPTTFNRKHKATLQSLENESIYGKSVGVNGFEDNEKIIKDTQPEIEVVWNKYPKNQKYILGVYNIMITRKDFLNIEHCFEFVGHLNIIENLLNTPSGSFNGGSEEILKNFLLTIDQALESRNQDKFSIRTISKS